MNTALRRGPFLIDSIEREPAASAVTNIRDAEGPARPVDVRLGPTDFQDACKKYGVKLHTHIGKGMMHCWGAMEFVPEAKAVRQEYFSALGRKPQSDRLKSNRRILVFLNMSRERISQRHR